MNVRNEPEEAPAEATDTQSPKPTGTHALEVAARLGFGPLSTQAQEAWHGHGVPCVTCGQIVRRDATACGQCGQNLRPAMLEKMKAHAGPWYVLEHLRPFPGVNLERIVKQIHRGLITETSIVRGPATHHQWRFALETPGLCRYFGKCWKCFSPVGQTETHCQQCGAHLTFEPPRPPGRVGAAQSAAPNGGLSTGPAQFAHHGAGASQRSASELDHLRAALSRGAITTPETRLDQPVTIAGIRAGWFAAVAVGIVLSGLWLVARSRTERAPTLTVPPPVNVAPGATTPGL